MRPVVIHLTSAELSVEAAERLAFLVGERAAPAAQEVWHLGAGASPKLDKGRPRRSRRVPLAANCAEAAAPLLRWRLAGGRYERVTLHAWTPPAARAGVGAVGERCRMVVEAPSPALAARSVAWPLSGRLVDTPWYVCPTEAVRSALLNCGVAAEHAVWVRPAAIGAGGAADKRAIDERAADTSAADERAAGERAATRAALGLEDSDFAVLPLPPYAREMGTLATAWGAMLAEKVYGQVRLVLPAGGRECARVRRLVEACAHAGMMRVADALPLNTLLGAADLAFFVPAGEAPVDGLVRAVAAGCPVVARATPGIREVLEDGELGRLIAASTPAAVARAIVGAVERRDEMVRAARRARDEAGKAFAAERLRAEYEGLYERAWEG